MSYVDVYKKRVGFLGTNIQEHSLNAGILNFKKYLNESSNRTLIDKYNDEGNPFPAVILSNKQDKTSLTKELHTVLEAGLAPGDIVRWISNDNLWILYQQKQLVLNTHQVNYIIRCNYDIKWVDFWGRIQHTPSYIVSSVDSKVKENFRTWHSMITPQPNKYMEILIPRRNDVAQGTKLIIDNEAWYIVEIDVSSIPGLMYMSLVESRVNTVIDDVENSLANTDEIGMWKIQLPDLITVEPNSLITLAPLVTHKGENRIQPIDFIVDGNIEIIDGELYSTDEGVGSILCYLLNANDIQATVKVDIKSAPGVLNFIPRGATQIRLDREEVFTLWNNLSQQVDIITASINDETLANIQVIGGVALLTANNKNKLGTTDIILNIGLESETIITINIVPLW